MCVCVFQNLCINEDVMRLKYLTLINDRCLEMQRNKKKSMYTWNTLCSTTNSVWYSIYFSVPGTHFAPPPILCGTVYTSLYLEHTLLHHQFCVVQYILLCTWNTLCSTTNSVWYSIYFSALCYMYLYNYDGVVELFAMHLLCAPSDS